jgi:hypothetical protein
MILARPIGRTLRLAAALSVFTSPAFAQSISYTCFPNGSITAGKHIQPTQAEIEARLNTPACRAAFGDSYQSVDQSTAVQRELSGIDQEIEQQRKGLANSSTPGTN